MKAIIGKTAAALLLGGLFATSLVAAAEQKIGTVDLKKVFEGYFKTKLVNASLEDEVSGLRKDSKALLDDYQKALDDYKKSNEEANNQALAFDEREKRKKEAEGKLVKVNDAKQSLEQFERTATSNLEEKQRIAKEKILGEILSVIANQAKAAGYSQVQDSAAEGLSKTRIVLYDSGQNDITDAVLKELNANAPANLPTTSSDKNEKKPKEK
jgi:Skp family chaperone for outer membrane proteins